MANVTAQAQTMAEATGPVLAYCASGNRSSIVWALAQAGKRPVEELVGIPARFGYQLDHLRPQIEALARQAGIECGTASEASEVPYEAIIKAAQEHGCDLIFMASHGRRGIAGLLLGSETQKVLTHSKTPVLVYR